MVCLAFAKTVALHGSVCIANASASGLTFVDRMARMFSGLSVQTISLAPMRISTVRPGTWRTRCAISRRELFLILRTNMIPLSMPVLVTVSISAIVSELVCGSRNGSQEGTGGARSPSFDRLFALTLLLRKKKAMTNSRTEIAIDNVALTYDAHVGRFGVVLMVSEEYGCNSYLRCALYTRRLECESVESRRCRASQAWGVVVIMLTIPVIGRKQWHSRKRV